MAKASIIWAPSPFKAGFCVIDDTDHSSLEAIKTVYDFLAEVGFHVTKTAWTYPQEDCCGIPCYDSEFDTTPALTNEEYAAYLDGLYERGFEISSHGASAGNNQRESTIASLRLVASRYGGTDTYVQHSKNAENLYYEEQVAPSSLLRMLVKGYSKFTCSGEEEGSPYFWGDVCRERVKQVRLFRTRFTNTYKVNPSMPYYDPRKPYVRSWFAATKRALHHCAEPAAIARLKRQRGITILYQYLTMYVDSETGLLSGDLRLAVERIVADPQIWVTPAGRLMQRLRDMQRVFLFTRGSWAWIVNTNPHDVKGIQIESITGNGISSETLDIGMQGATVVVTTLPAASVHRIQTPGPQRWQGVNLYRMPASLRRRIKLPFAVLHVNAGETEWQTGSAETVGARSFALKFDRGVEDIEPMVRTGTFEEHRLFFHQMWIIIRQILFQGRSLNARVYCDKADPRPQSHYFW